MELNAQRIRIPAGQRGIRTTVRHLTDLSVNAATDPFVIRVARAVISSVPEGDTQGELTALSNYVRQSVRYTGDPAGAAGRPDSGAELVTDPRYLLREIEGGQGGYGDCDDMVALLASMAMSVGHPVRFVTRSQHSSGPHEHIYLEALDRSSNTWWPIDPIVRQDFTNSFRGRVVPGARQTERYPAMRGGLGMIQMRNPGLAPRTANATRTSDITFSSYRGLGFFDALVNALPSLAKTGADFYMGREQMKQQEEIAKANLELQREQIALQRQLAAQTSAPSSGGLGSVLQGKGLLVIGGVALAFLMLRK